MYNYYDYKTMFSPEEILVYLRKSRADDPTLSIEEVLQKHETILNEWATRYLGEKIPETNYFREVVSGESIEDRIAFQKILKLIESPKIKAVLVVELQRLGRPDLEEIGRITKLFRYTGTMVITPQKTYDIRDEYDRDAFERELKRGNEYLEYQKKIMARGRLLSVSQGNFISSIPPYGYNRITITEGNRKCPTLEENKEQADAVRMIFDLYVNKDMGYQKICNTLENLNITPPKGKYWSPAALKDMISNVHYIGKVKWNWRKTITVVEDSEVVKTRPKAKVGEFFIYEGKHEAIVSEELFNAAQEKMGKNARVGATKNIINPLAGLLYCHCGRAMVLRLYKNKDGSERSAARLLCGDQTHCNTGSCTQEELLDRICDILENCIKDFECKIEKGTEDLTKIHLNIIKNLEKNLKDKQDREVALWEAQADPDPEKRMPQEIFKKLKDKIVKEKDDIQKALKQAYETMPEPVNYEEQTIRFKDALAALKNPNIDAAIKNKLLKSCIERIEYRREKPKRLTLTPEEKKEKTFASGGSRWSDPLIEIDVKLKV